MLQYVYLMAAIVCEVGGTLCLRAAATGRMRWYAAVAVGYAAAFVLLLLSLRKGMPLGIAYGVWVATGVALTAVAARVLFDEPLTRRMLSGIAIIVVGVLLIELGAVSH
jgi:small multidrug resistance pump